VAGQLGLHGADAATLAVTSVWILGDQLLEAHAAMAHARAGSERVEVIMVESARRLRRLPYHKKKLVLLLSARARGLPLQHALLELPAHSRAPPARESSPGARRARPAATRRGRAARRPRLGAGAPRPARPRLSGTGARAPGPPRQADHRR
jgi:hypothetical protein